MEITQRKYHSPSNLPADYLPGTLTTCLPYEVSY